MSGGPPRQPASSREAHRSLAKAGALTSPATPSCGNESLNSVTGLPTPLRIPCRLTSGKWHACHLATPRRILVLEDPASRKPLREVLLREGRPARLVPKAHVRRGTGMSAGAAEMVTIPGRSLTR
jgi:hypothetical protein